MSLFKSNYSKWIPFGIYSHGSQQYLSLVRKNFKTGMIYFKSKRIQRSIYHSPFVPYTIIDVKAAWEQLHAMQQIPKPKIKFYNWKGAGEIN